MPRSMSRRGRGATRASADIDALLARGRRARDEYDYPSARALFEEAALIELAALAPHDEGGPASARAALPPADEPGGGPRPARGGGGRARRECGCRPRRCPRGRARGRARGCRGELSRGAAPSAPMTRAFEHALEERALSLVLRQHRLFDDRGADQRDHGDRLGLADAVRAIARAARARRDPRAPAPRASPEAGCASTRGAPARPPHSAPW